MAATLAHTLDSSPSFRWLARLRGGVFRYGFSYWVVMCLVFLPSQIPGFNWFGKVSGLVWNPIVRRVGKTVLGASFELGLPDNGSGDKTSDWIAVLCVASIALIVAVVWSVLDRRRAHDARLRELLRVVVRYTLAFIVLDYGVAKLFLLQFSPPGTARLLTRFGDSSPMGLLWTFMGSSPAYVFFSGAAETLGVVLLWFRRTTTLGALVLTVVLVNIVMLNFCYDVPVKINSAHYLAMAVFLWLPELGRLANVIVFNRATQPVTREPLLTRRWMRVAGLVIKVSVIGIALYVVVSESAGARQARESDAWYNGYWSVTRFTRDGQDIPAIVTDSTRWSRIRFQASTEKLYVRWRFMDDSFGDLYTAVIDESQQTVSLTPADLDKPTHPAGPVVLRYRRGDAGHLQLEGKVGDATLAVQVERFDPGTMLLTSRGFHWISEAPFSR